MSEHAVNEKGSGSKLASENSVGNGSLDPFRNLSDADTILYWRVFNVIKSRTKLNPVKSSVLERQFQISDSKVRAIVHFFRYDLLKPIVSGQNGYFLAMKPQDWIDCAKSLKQRGYTIINGIDKITKHNFSGQADIFEN